MDTNAITHVSLCSGYGGIDLGLKRAIGRSLRTVAYVEVESFAVANLVAKASQELLDEAPVWSDLRSFPWRKFHGLVDILSGGYPCQPFSAAGKRLGAEDPRHLWPHISAGIALMRPSVCFFENVEGHISLGLPDVIEDLAGLGYRTTWCVASASEVGAPHQRKRVFILAYDQRQRIEELGRQIAVGSQLNTAWDDGGLDNANSMAAGGVAGILGGTQGEEQGEGLQRQRPRHAAGYAGEATAWPSRPGEQQFWWEPPRVVADNHRPYAGHGEQRPERTLGDLSGGCGEELEHANGAHAGQNAGADCGGEQAHQGQMGQGDEQWQSDGSSDAAIMGDTAHTNRRTRVSAEEAGTGPDDIWRRRSGESGDGAMGISENGNPRRDALQLRPGQAQHQGASGSVDQGRRQTQPSLGRNPDGPAHWLDDAELFTTCDNRTDELRLLGNGVVPATQSGRSEPLLVN